MNDSDRHDQIEALAELKRLLDDEEGANADDIRDAAIRAVNRFDHSIAVHDDWHAYSRRCSASTTFAAWRRLFLPVPVVVNRDQQR